MSTRTTRAFPAGAAGEVGDDRAAASAGASVTQDWPNVHAPDAMRATTDLALPQRTAGSWRVWLTFLRNPSATAGLVVLVTVIAIAALAPWLYPGDPLAMVGRPLLWPGQNAGFPLGTDSLGRDLAAEIAHGARVSLSIGIIATAVCLVVGTLVGAVAGYFGSWIEDLLVRVIEIFQTVPAFVLLIALVAISEPTVPSITLEIALVSWPPVARLVRAEFRSIREKEFVLAARSQGYGHTRIILSEILPNALPPVIVMSSVMVATAILMETALSFMGLGDPNVVSWGSMIGGGHTLLRSAWFLCAVPGVAIIITVLALNFVGDGLNDALNPRLHEGQ